MSKHPTNPCTDCPFARSCPPGETGGSNPGVFVGQAYGPFHLGCHSIPGYANKATPITFPQCAGASIFRANVGIADKMPSGLIRREADRVKVFASAAELIAHHTGLSIDRIEQRLKAVTEEDLRDVEMSKVEARYYPASVLPREE